MINIEKPKDIRFIRQVGTPAVPYLWCLSDCDCDHDPKYKEIWYIFDKGKVKKPRDIRFNSYVWLLRERKFLGPIARQFEEHFVIAKRRFQHGRDRGIEIRTLAPTTDCTYYAYERNNYSGVYVLNKELLKQLYTYIVPTDKLGYGIKYPDYSRYLHDGDPGGWMDRRWYKA